MARRDEGRSSQSSRTENYFYGDLETGFLSFSLEGLVLWQLLPGRSTSQPISGLRRSCRLSFALPVSADHKRNEKVGGHVPGNRPRNLRPENQIGTRIGRGCPTSLERTFSKRIRDRVAGIFFFMVMVPKYLCLLATGSSSSADFLGIGNIAND